MNKLCLVKFLLSEILLNKIYKEMKMKYQINISVVLLLFVSLFILSSQLRAQNGWIHQNSGTSNNLYSVEFIDDNTGYAVGKNGTIIKTTNKGNTWLPQVSGATGTLYCVNFINVNTGITVGESGLIRKTTNGGINWFSQTFCTSYTIKSVYFNDVNTGIIVGHGGKIRKTINGGSNWLCYCSGTTNNLNSVYFINANTGWAVGTSGTILKTMNGGVNWLSQIAPTTSYELTSVYFINANTGLITKANYNYTRSMYRTTNGGANWYEIYTGSVHSLRAIDFIDDNTGYLIGDEGDIFKTSNSGANWTFLPSGVMNWLYSGTFINANTGWAVGTSGIILYTTSGATGVKQIGTEIPRKFELYQNYPNPFNPSTNIRFDILKSSNVKIVVYDNLGRIVSELLNEKLSTGSYEVEWKASGHPSGIYFYKIITKEFSDVQKMILLK